MTSAVHAVSVSGLKPNPEGGLLQAPGARDALATALFWDGEISLVRSAHAAKPPSRHPAHGRRRRHSYQPGVA